VIGAIAIAGVPPLAGFFSKDEILFRTFAHGSQIMWTIGMITSLLTATYMFRLVFLTFHGERRHDAPSAAAPAHTTDHGSPASDHGSPAPDHGHADHLHDAPFAMAFALIILAIGSFAAGWIGVPHALGGNNYLEKFLEPSFEAHGLSLAPAEFQGGEIRLGPRPEGALPRVELPAEAAAAPHVDESTELKLMGLSSIVAAVGIVIATYFWLLNRAAAVRVARGAAPIYTLLLNKYFVDELYDAVFVQPIKQMSTLLLWRGVDVGVIDGSVNGVGALMRAASTRLRQLQSGSIRAYAASLFIGVVVLLGWYLMR
jgi:NADH-quinone oxidoreductase subunit L